MVKVTDRDFYMDGILRSNLNGLVDNIRDDWNFTIIVSGTGQTRVGKTCHAQQIGYYLAHKLGTPFTLQNNICFTGKDLQKNAINSPPYSVFVYDEARRGLSISKRYNAIHQNLMDFFNECGQLNQIILVVLPDFFDLKKEIAIGMSHCLINVRYKIKKTVNKDSETSFKLERGYFDFYGMSRKRDLYIRGKQKNNSYACVKSNFYGRFTDFWVIDEVEYKKGKKKFLESDTVEKEGKKDKFMLQRNALIYHLVKERDLTHQETANVLDKYGFKVDRRHIGRICDDFPKKSSIGT